MSNNWVNAIEQIKRKEEAGLSYIYSKTYNYVYLRAKSMLKKEEDIQQLMKDVYIHVFKSANELKEETAYEWLGKVVYTLGAQRFRKKKVREATCIELEKHEMTSRKGANADPAVYVIGNVLEELPDLYQATFYAFFYDYMNVVEIAEVMDSSIGAILNRLNYTIKYMKKAIEIYNEEEGKSKKEKASFAVDIICAALRKWSIDHCMGMATAQTLYASICKELNLAIGSIYMEGKEFAGVNNTVVYHKIDDMTALQEEIDFYKKKPEVDKQKIAIMGGIAAAVILLVIIIAVVVGGKDEKDKNVDKNPPTTQEQNNDAEDVNKEDSDDKDVSNDQNTESNEADNSEENNDTQQEETGDNSVVSNEDYIIPMSDTVELTEADLESFSKEELRLARNEIYARHGMIFGVDDLDEYFRTKSWYEPKYKSGEFYEKVEMSLIEEANVEFILSVEQSR